MFECQSRCCSRLVSQFNLHYYLCRVVVYIWHSRITWVMSVRWNKLSKSLYFGWRFLYGYKTTTANLWSVPLDLLLSLNTLHNQWGATANTIVLLCAVILRSACCSTGRRSVTRLLSVDAGVFEYVCGARWVHGTQQDTSTKSRAYRSEQVMHSTLNG